MAHTQSQRNGRTLALEEAAENPIMNISSTMKEEPELWLPIPINFEGSQLCEIHSSRKLNETQRAFQPITSVLSSSNEFYPLLINIPIQKLTTMELKLRKVNLYEDTYSIEIPYKNKHIELEVKQALESYGRKWNIHPSVLMINLNRLYQLPPKFTLKEYFIKQQRVLKTQYDFSLQEWFLMLEFYLQMDGACFYLKTCSFRDSTSTMVHDGIFCNTEPQAEHGMKACRDKTCRFCNEPRDITHRFEPTVSFSDRQIHRFLNNYEVYLNRDVTCTTSNIIYALTCPCRRLDYIGRCVVPFRDRMRNHRIYGTRLVANAFLGQFVADRLKDDRDPDPTFPDDQNRLYEHSTYCSTALNIFLTAHPEFWCLVPMTKEQAILDNNNMLVHERNLLEAYANSSIIKSEPNQYTRDMNLVRWCIKNLPSPPPDYHYSLRQQLEQYEFFLHQQERFVSRFLSLYNAAIVIALPENASDAVRHVIQALLIIYAEPKLNIMRTECDTVCESSDNIDGVWCKALIHPRCFINSASSGISSASRMPR